MRTVYKYPLSFDEEFNKVNGALLGPVVLVDKDPASGAIAVWIEGRPTNPGSRIFTIRGTGHAIPAGAMHVGSVIDLPFVWHVYEVSS